MTDIFVIKINKILLTGTGNAIHNTPEIAQREPTILPVQKTELIKKVIYGLKNIGTKFTPFTQI